MSYPLPAAQAATHVSVLRDGMGVMHYGYNSECWDRLILNLQSDDFPYRRTHDAVLEATLLNHGVKTFYTRNTKDFVSAGFDQVRNPVDPLWRRALRRTVAAVYDRRIKATPDLIERRYRKIPVDMTA